MFFRHFAPGVFEGEAEDGVGQFGELVGQGFHCPFARQILYGETENLGVAEAAQGVHFRFGVFAGVEFGGQLASQLRPVGAAVGQLGAEQFVE